MFLVNSLIGYVGLNNLKFNDYANVIFLILSHINPIRDFFLLQAKVPQSELVIRVGRLIRKIWNPKGFKDHVNPHELLQEISLSSKKMFVLDKKSDPLDLMTYLINSIHSGLGGSRKKNTIVTDTLQGVLKICSQVTVSISSESQATTGKY